VGKLMYSLRERADVDAINYQIEECGMGRSGCCGL
jgi:hypothetical protein